MSALLRRLGHFCVALIKGRRPNRTPSEQRAHDLIIAIDRGGVPLNPMIVNRIARGLGLRVSPADPMQLTIDKIRKQLSAASNNQE